MFSSISKTDSAVAALHGLSFDPRLLADQPFDVNDNTVASAHPAHIDEQHKRWPRVSMLYVARCQLVRRGARLFPHEGAAELPVCAVCLERMDSSITGLITTQCTHTFHCSCYGNQFFFFDCIFLLFYQFFFKKKQTKAKWRGASGSGKKSSHRVSSFMILVDSFHTYFQI